MNKSTLTRQCICNWDDTCKDAANIFKYHLSDNHPWKGNGFQCVPTNKSKKALAFAKSLHLVFKKGEVVCGKKIYIARHHFSQDLLRKHPGHRHKFLTRSEVRSLDRENDMSHGGYEVYRFSLFALLKTGNEKDKNMFIGAPLVSKNEVVSLMSTLVSKMALDHSSSSFSTPVSLKRVRNDFNELVSTSPPKKLKLPVVYLKTENQNDRTRLISTDFTTNENDLLYKSIDSIHEGMIYIWKQSVNIDEFSNKNFVKRAMNDISFQARQDSEYPYIFELAKDIMLHVCVNPVSEHCKMFKILKKTSSERNYCEECFKDKIYADRRKHRRDTDAGRRIQSSSHVNVAYLSPDSTKKRLLNRKNEIKLLSQKVNRLQLKFTKAKESQLIPLVCDSVKATIRKAFEHITSSCDRNTLKKDILKALLYDNNAALNVCEKEVHRFASRICCLLDAEAQKLDGNVNATRYDYRLKRLALSHYLNYGKSAYNQLRESSLEILPCIRSNDYYFSHLRGGPGSHCARFASQFFDAINYEGNKSRKEEIVVQVIFDEIKIQCGVGYNAKTGKEIGFTSSKNGKMMNFAEEILKIAKESCSMDDDTIRNEDEELEKYVDAATYANVWRLRTYDNRTWNVGYFFNSGSLDSDDLVKQLLIVLLVCRFVGLQTKLQMSDAGGANSRLIRVLSKNRKSIIQGVPEQSILKYVNPVDPSTNIWISLCSVHGLKCTKKLLADRKHLFNNGYHINWKVVIALYHIVNEHAKNPFKVHDLRGLRRSVAYPDAYSQQNVNDSKRVFEEDCISFQLQKMANDLNAEANIFDDILKDYYGNYACSGEIL